MDAAALTKLAIALGVTWAVYKFAPSPVIKAAAVGVMGTMIAKRIPYVADALA